MGALRVNAYKTTEGCIIPERLKLMRKNDTKKMAEVM